jgi:hypothetical protein
MKNKTRIIAIIIAFLAVISASCAKTAGKELTDDEVVELYNKAKEAYGWFDLTTIPYDAEKYIEIDGERYFEVAQPGITSKRTLSDYLNEVFSDDITEGLMETSSYRYVESKGKLYVLPMDRGTDIFKGAESYEVVRVSEKQIKFTVTVEIYEDPTQKNVTEYKQYDFFLEFSDGRWRFKNFELVR